MRVATLLALVLAAELAWVGPAAQPLDLLALGLIEAALVYGATRWGGAGGRQLLLVWGLGALSAAVMAPGWPPAPGDPRPAEGPRLVLVTLDTFRADHLGALGQARAVPTPNLDALAERGAFWPDGVAAVPLTGPAHAALLTGRPPWEVGVVRNGTGLDPGATTVAERLRSAGWRTGAFVSARVLERGFGFERGFDHYDDDLDQRAALRQAALPWLLRGLLPDRPRERGGDRTVAAALRWASTQAGPTFLWVHLYDCHAPYAPPAGFPAPWDPEDPQAPGHPAEVRAAWRPERGFSRLPGDLRRPVARYAGEVRWVDHLVGRLVDGLPPQTRWVIAADHGESLLEHGLFLDHGPSLHQPALAVPFWVVAPEVPPGPRLGPVPQDRVAGSVLALAGLSSELAPLWAEPPEEIFSLTRGQQARAVFGPPPAPQVARRAGAEKWVVSQGKGGRFDLERDPSELAPEPAPGDPAWARALLQTADPPVEADLEALGYLQP